MSATQHRRIVERVMTRLKLRQLRLLIAVGRHGNIQAAAGELNVSQPAATKMIKDLELDFEVQLFERTNRGVIPTAAGEALIRHGKLIFAQVSHAAQELDDLAVGSRGREVVGTLLAASSRLLPEAIGRLLASRPRVAVRVVEGTNEVLMPALRAGEIDLVVGRLPTHRHREDLEQVPLFQERIVLVAGREHPLAGRDAVTFDDLRPHGWILPPPGTTLRRQVDRFFVEMDGYAPPGVVESVSFLTNRALLGQGSLLGFLPSQVASRGVAAGVMTTLPFDVPFGAGPVGVSFRGEDRMSPAGRALLDALRAVAEEIARGTSQISAVDRAGK